MKTSHPSRRSYPGIHKFGAAYNGGKFANAAGVQRSGNHLIYGIADQALYRVKPGSNQGFDATLGLDWSPQDVNRENSQITAALRYNAPIPSRPLDSANVGFVYTRIGDPFRTESGSLGLPILGTERPSKRTTPRKSRATS